MSSAFQKTAAGSDHPMSANPYGATAFGGLSHVPSNMQSGPLAYIPMKKVETEEEKIRRYDKLVEKLKVTLNNERKILKACRLQYNKELNSKTELEEMLKQAVDKVKNERKQHRRNAQQKIYTAQPGLGVGVTHVISGHPISTGGQEHEEIELNQQERERVIELMLNQGRVIQLLYEKTFAMTGLEGNQNAEEDIQEYSRLKQMENAEYGEEMDDDMEGQEEAYEDHI